MSQSSRAPLLLLQGHTGPERRPSLSATSLTLLLLLHHLHHHNPSALLPPAVEASLPRSHLPSVFASKGPVMDSREEQQQLLLPTMRSGSGLLLLLPQPESSGSSTGSSPAREPPPPQGKPGKPAPFCRERAELLLMEEQQQEHEEEEGSARKKDAPGERHRRDGSSSDTESDFYEEIDVSCTPESLDYPAGRGRDPNLGCGGGDRARQGIMRLQLKCARSEKKVRRIDSKTVILHRRAAADALRSLEEPRGFQQPKPKQTCAALFAGCMQDFMQTTSLEANNRESRH